MKLAEEITKMVKAPFIGSLDLLDLFLLVGLVLVFITMWIFVLAHIRSAAMEFLPDV